jgi:hypothetical protein
MEHWNRAYFLGAFAPVVRYQLICYRRWPRISDVGLGHDAGAGAAHWNPPPQRRDGSVIRVRTELKQLATLLLPNCVARLGIRPD